MRLLSSHTSIDVNAQDSQGLAAFGSAAKRRRLECAQHLLPLTLLTPDIYRYECCLFCKRLYAPATLFLSEIRCNFLKKYLSAYLYKNVLVCFKNAYFETMASQSPLTSSSSDLKRTTIVGCRCCKNTNP